MKTKHHSYLKIISNAKSIHDHPLNLSKSKQLFTFPKSKRFQTQKKKNLEFYNLTQNSKKGRTCSFGIGKKSDFTKKSKITNPGPQYYKNDFLTISKNLEKKKFSFGYSREKCNIIGEKSIKEIKKIPGPGKYDLLNFNKSKKSCSFRIKTKKVNKNNSLGPGKYSFIPTIGENAKLSLSIYKSNGFTKINPIGKNKSLLKNKENFKNFNKFHTKYDTKFRINKKGVFFNTKYENSKCGVFGKSKRRYLSQKKIVPGPGSYLLPSDFGVYMSSTVKRH